MRYFRISEVSKEVTPNPHYTGGEVTIQNLVSPEIANNFSFRVVNFSAGSKNSFHIHTSDQILHIIDGTGIVATEAGEQVVTPGDVVQIEAGEKHWHGATEESAMTHVAIMAADCKTDWLDP